MNIFKKKLLSIILVLIMSVLCTSCRYDSCEVIGNGSHKILIVGTKSDMNNYVNAEMKYNNNSYDCIGYDNFNKTDITLMCHKK